MRRLGLRLRTQAYIRAWLAHTEYAGLDWVRAGIRDARNRGEADWLLRVLCLVKAPEAAPVMLDLKLDSKAPALARQWLDENAAHAVAGLVPVAAGHGKLAEAALHVLRTARSEGLGAFLEEQLVAADPTAAERVRREVIEQDQSLPEPLDDATTPAWLRQGLVTPGGLPPLPDWVRPANLLPLVVDGRRLNDDQARAVVGALAWSTLDTPHAVLALLKRHIAQPVLDAFAWKLFEQWMAEGAPPGQKWALRGVGLLGGDACALKLVPLLRAWPGESQHPRAVLGLECLRAIGSDTALTQLNGIAQKLKFQGLKKKAQEFMEAIAKDKGLSRAELEDRIVPDLDLDEKGSRILDFGPRQFRVVLGPDLAPRVRDDAGKVKADLPKPGVKDDPEKAPAAVVAWKMLKKQLREALKVQTPRLEQAMVTGRRWKPEQFQALLVRHPLMTHLVRRLLWGAYDAGGKLLGTFRVNEDQAFADVEDRPWDLSGAAAVGIVHPLHLGEEQRNAWGQVLGDYEVIAPFPQLGRPLHVPTPPEQEKKVMTRFVGVKVPAPSLRGTLERLGWSRGSASDHGALVEFVKPFPAVGVTAVVENEPGIPIGMPDWTEDQEIKRAFFRQGSYESVAYSHHKEADMVPVGKVDAVAVSEVFADLTAVASKANG
jgi:hypothetical protein